MRVVRLGPIPTPCKYCGAVMSRPHENPYGMCFNCHGDFRMWREPDDNDESAPFMFLARRLRIDAHRLATGKIVGRCECLSIGANVHRGDTAYQCATPARDIINGVKMCGSHAKLSLTGDAIFIRDTFYDTTGKSEYDFFVAPMRELAAMDPDFRAAIQRAVAA